MKNKVFKNYLYNLSYQILLMILPVITTPYVSRVLSPENIGNFNYTYSIIAVVIIVAQLGTNMYGQREIAYVQDNIEKRSKVFWEIFIIRIITSLIILPVYIILSLVLKKYTELMLWMIIYILANLIDVSWFFQGMEEFKKTAIRSIGIKLIGVILIFILVKEPNDIIIYTIILAMSQFLGNILLFVYVPSKIKLIKRKELVFKNHIKPILALFIPTASIYIYTYVDKILLGVLSSTEQVGFYSQSEKIVKLLMTVITSLGIVMLPHIASVIKNDDKKQIKNKIEDAMDFIICLGCPMVVGAFIVADRFIPWFLGSDYIQSILIFKILTPLILIIGTASVVGQAVLIPLKKQRIYTISVVVGAILNLVFNLIFIPKMEAIGSAMATVIAELSVTTIQMIAIQRYIGIKFFKIIKLNWRGIISSVVMAAVLVVLNYYLPNDDIWLIVQVMVGCIIYFGCLIILKDKFIDKILKVKMKIS